MQGDNIRDMYVELGDHMTQMTRDKYSNILLNWHAKDWIGARLLDVMVPILT